MTREEKVCIFNDFDGVIISPDEPMNLTEAIEIAKAGGAIKELKNW